MCPRVCDRLFVHTLLKAVWVVKDSDSLQVVLDKERITKATVETIFSPYWSSVGRPAAAEEMKINFPAGPQAQLYF